MQSQEEISLEKFNKAIDAIIESDRKLKLIDSKLTEKKKLLKQGEINIGDIGLLPLIWEGYL